MVNVSRQFPGWISHKQIKHNSIKCRALESAGVKDYSIDLEKQKVLVTSSLSAETVKEVVEQTGRTAGLEIAELSDY